MSQVLGVTPFYYTGEQDSKDAFQDGFLLLFLQNHGYKKFLSELGTSNEPRQKRPYNKKPKAVETENGQDGTPEPPHDAESAEHQDGTINVQLSLPDSDKTQKVVEEMSGEEAVLLLQALLVRSKSGGQAAKNAELVKRLLLQ